MEKNSMFHEPAFRKIVVGSTAIGLSCMLASLAALRIDRSGLRFQWHWSILIVVVATVLWNRHFWRAVWDTQDDPSAKTKQRLLVHLGILAALGIGSFLYPIRFIEQSYWGGIVRGLLTAGTFLGTMLWLIYKCGRGLEQIDATELDRQGQRASS